MSNHIDEPTEEEMDFIRAVLANPDDDAIRLIYADWLEERDKSVGYIREQLQETMQLYSSSREWLGKKRRIYSAITVYSKDIRSIHDLNKPRAFYEYIRCPAEWWLKHADEVTKYHPIREVHLTTEPNIERWFDDSAHQIGFKLQGYKNCTGVLRSSMDSFEYRRLLGPIINRDGEKYLLARYWPQITFVLPNGERIGHEADTATPQAT